MLIAFASDRLRHRFLFALLPIAIAIAGFAILLAEHSNHNLEYAALFLVTMGTYSAMPVIVCCKTLPFSHPTLFPAANLLSPHRPIFSTYARSLTSTPPIGFNLNLGGHHRRAVGTAWQIGFGNIGGIIATYAFLAKDAPFYTRGYAICVGFICLSALSCCVYFAAVWGANKHRERERMLGREAEAGLSEREVEERGDLAGGYRYQL